MLAEGVGAKLDPEGLTALLDSIRDDVHQAQPAALSITNASEYGCVYTPEETAKRAEEAIRRSFATPHKPRKSVVGTTPRAKAMARTKDSKKL